MTLDQIIIFCLKMCSFFDFAKRELLENKRPISFEFGVTPKLDNIGLGRSEKNGSEGFF